MYCSGGIWKSKSVEEKYYIRGTGRRKVHKRKVRKIIKYLKEEKEEVEEERMQEQKCLL